MTNLETDEGSKRASTEHVERVEWQVQPNELAQPGKSVLLDLRNCVSAEIQRPQPSQGLEGKVRHLANLVSAQKQRVQLGQPGERIAPEGVKFVLLEVENFERFREAPRHRRQLVVVEPDLAQFFVTSECVVFDLGIGKSYPQLLNSWKLVSYCQSLDEISISIIASFTST